MTPGLKWMVPRTGSYSPAWKYTSSTAPSSASRARYSANSSSEHLCEMVCNIDTVMVIIYFNNEISSTWTSFSSAWLEEKSALLVVTRSSTLPPPSALPSTSAGW